MREVGNWSGRLLPGRCCSHEQLLEIANQVIGAGWQSGKFLYVDSDLKIDLPEARVVLDRERIADLGLDLASVGQELGTLLGGAYVNRFNFFDRSYKVIPQIGEENRSTLDPLLDLKIRTPGGGLVPVSTFTRIETTTAPRTLNRFNQVNAVRIIGAVNPGVTKDEGLSVLEEAATAAGGKNVTLEHAGESRQIRREGAALTVTLAFSLVLIYLVLAAQFASFRDPLIVLLGSVPLAISGALLFSFLDLTTINIYSQVGLITLVGLIAKNGILIVQFANAQQALGLSRLAAVKQAALTRLRPVLMTSAAMVFGQLPLVFVDGPGAAARNSIGIILVAGMIVGTVFTLFVVPVFYSLLSAKHERAQEPEPALGQPATATLSVAMTRTPAITLLLSSLLLAACAVGPDYKPPETDAAQRFDNLEPGTFTTEATVAEFWTLFEDETLERLVADALAANHDLRIALTRVAEARALRGETRLDLAPTVTAGAGYSDQRLADAQLSGTPFVPRDQELYDAGFDAFWELDFFGRIRRAVEASNAELDAAEASLRDAQVIVTAEVTRTYFELRGQQQQLDVARRNVDNQRETLELTA